VRRIGRADLLEVPEFKTGGGRFENMAALKLIIEEWFATLPNDDEAVRILADELRLPAARVLSVGQFAQDPVLSRRMVAKVPAPDGNEMLLLKSPHKFSRTPPSDPGPAAALGEHTSEILRSACGYSQDKIDTLLREGVVTETHPG
jgi:crotonobetainyl-CoA:carnitine CoA-transferase CaiB-like acyl-CoA transferase